MKNEYLIHYGILGMKWGTRKSKFDKALIKKDRAALVKRGHHSGDAKSIAKNAQRRMLKKGENHSVAIKKAARNHYLKQIGLQFATSAFTFAMVLPEVRSAMAKGGYILGAATGRGMSNAAYKASRISKMFNRNMTTIKPSDVSRGREIVGLLMGGK